MAIIKSELTTTQASLLESQGESQIQAIPDRFQNLHETLKTLEPKIAVSVTYNNFDCPHYNLELSDSGLLYPNERSIPMYEQKFYDFVTATQPLISDAKIKFRLEQIPSGGPDIVNSLEALRSQLEQKLANTLSLSKLRYGKKLKEKLTECQALINEGRLYLQYIDAINYNDSNSGLSLEQIRTMHQTEENKRQAQRSIIQNMQDEFNKLVAQPVALKSKSVEFTYSDKTQMSPADRIVHFRNYLTGCKSTRNGDKIIQKHLLINGGYWSASHIDSFNQDDNYILNGKHLGIDRFSVINNTLLVPEGLSTTTPTLEELKEILKQYKIKRASYRQE